MTTTRLAGWGNTAAVQGRTIDVMVESVSDVIIAEPRLIARGLGRAYGDCAYVSGGATVRLTGDLARIEFDGRSVEVDAAVSLDRLMRAAIPRGLFVPVTPGTRFVTVGGAIAADIHGKNHHRDGSFGSHCEWIELVTASGATVRVSPADDADLYWATVGGMGLTGVIVRARVNLVPVDTAYMTVQTSKHGSLAELMDDMQLLDPVFRYTVAWVDTLATGKGFGRSVLWAGNHAGIDEIPRRHRSAARAFDPRQRITMPAVPGRGVISPLSVRAFNSAWFARAPRKPTIDVQSIPQYFHPLDGVAHWNRVYGRRGFIQYQFVVPEEAAELVGIVLKRMSILRIPAFLSVLKKFGAGNAGMMSFPFAGWTLAVDIPTAVDGLAVFLDDMDDAVSAAGGRVYLAKDSRLRAHHLPAMYPQLNRFRDIRRRVDPTGKFASNLSRRLSL